MSTDVGGKIATLEVMQSAGSATPDVGYWAGEWDATATYHGLYYTSVVDGKYVNVTTLPVLEVVRPLYRWGGYRASLLCSMLGAVAAAFAARALALRAGADEQRGWLAFGLIGLASPALALRTRPLGARARARRSWRGVWSPWSTPSPAGPAGPRWPPAWRSGRPSPCAPRRPPTASPWSAIGCVLLWQRRRVRRGRWWPGLLAAVGFVAMVAANYLLEVAVLGAVAAHRPGVRHGVGAAAPTSACGSRRPSPPTVGLFPEHRARPHRSSAWLAVAAAGVGGLAGVAPGDPRVARIAAQSVRCCCSCSGRSTGSASCPASSSPPPSGSSPSCSSPTAGSPGGPRRRGHGRRWPSRSVWMFQFSGGAVPQWGGRYVLTSGPGARRRRHRRLGPARSLGAQRPHRAQRRGRRVRHGLDVAPHPRDRPGRPTRSPR